MANPSYQVRAVAHELDQAKGDTPPKPPTNDEVEAVVEKALGEAFPGFRFNARSERLDRD